MLIKKLDDITVTHQVNLTIKKGDIHYLDYIWLRIEALILQAIQWLHSLSTKMAISIHWGEDVIFKECSE